MPTDEIYTSVKEGRRSVKMAARHGSLFVLGLWSVLSSMRTALFVLDFSRQLYRTNSQFNFFFRGYMTGT